MIALLEVSRLRGALPNDLVGLLVIIVLLLAAAALVKYCNRDRRSGSQLTLRRTKRDSNLYGAFPVK